MTLGVAEVASAFAKLERAQKHIRDLKIELQKLINLKPYSIIPHLQENGGEVVWKIEFDPIPEEVECIAADAVHNLRTPLDRMLTSGFPSAKIHKGDAELRKIAFPIAPSRDAFEERKLQQAKNLRPEVIDFLSGIAPFNGGQGEVFWALNELDNRDKHRPILMPMVVDFLVLQNRGLRSQRGQILRLGSSKGRHLVPVPDARPGAWHLHQPVEHLAPILRIAPATLNDFYLEFSSEHGDTELFTTTADAIICHADITPEICVSFNDMASLTGKPVISSLDVMFEDVKAVLSDFERTFCK